MAVFKLGVGMPKKQKGESDKDYQARVKLWLQGARRQADKEGWKP